MTNDDVFSLVKQEIMSVLPLSSENEIGLEKRLVDLGANSIDRAEIAISCMRKLEVKIDPMTLSQVKNIGDLVQALCSALNGRVS